MSALSCFDLAKVKGSNSFEVNVVDILDSVASSNGSSVNPKDLLDQLAAQFKEYKKRNQQDAHECLKRIFSILSDTFLEANFQGILESNLTCLNCLKVSRTREVFTDLSLNLQGTLLESIQEFFEIEKLDQQDQLYFCEFCKSKSKATRQYKIKENPNILILHFKRFTLKNSKNYVKDSRKIDFPMDLVVNSKNYDLCSVIVHSGQSMQSGHYYAFCKLQNNWIYRSDEKVQFTDQQRVLNSEAFILFYKMQEEEIIVD